MEQLRYQPGGTDMPSGSRGGLARRNEHRGAPVSRGFPGGEQVQVVGNPDEGVDADDLSQEGLGDTPKSEHEQLLEERRRWAERVEEIDLMVQRIDLAAEVLSDVKFIPPALGFIKQNVGSVRGVLLALDRWRQDLDRRRIHGMFRLTDIPNQLSQYLFPISRALREIGIDAAWLGSGRRANIRALDLAPADLLFNGFESWALPGLDADREASPVLSEGGDDGVDSEFGDLVGDIQEQMRLLAQEYKGVFPNGIAADLNEGLWEIAQKVLGYSAELENFKTRINDINQRWLNDGDSFRQLLGTLSDDLPNLISRLNDLEREGGEIDEELYKKFSQAKVEEWLGNLEELRKKLSRARELAAQKEAQIRQQLKGLKEAEQPQETQGNPSTPSARRVAQATHGHSQETPSPK